MDRPKSPSNHLAILPNNSSSSVRTAELSPVGDRDQTTNKPGSLQDNPDLSGRLPSPDGAFVLSGTPAFITPTAIEYLQTVPAGHRWTNMITSYLHLETFPVAKSVHMNCVVSNLH